MFASALSSHDVGGALSNFGDVLKDFLTVFNCSHRDSSRARAYHSRIERLADAAA